jgi:hypothetical protein
VRTRPDGACRGHAHLRSRHSREGLQPHPDNSRDRRAARPRERSPAGNDNRGELAKGRAAPGKRPTRAGAASPSARVALAVWTGHGLCPTRARRCASRAKATSTPLGSGRSVPVPETRAAVRLGGADLWKWRGDGATSTWWRPQGGAGQRQGGADRKRRSVRPQRVPTPTADGAAPCLQAAAVSAYGTGPAPALTQPTRTADCGPRARAVPGQPPARAEHTPPRPCRARCI